jgi:hypothetical protein
LIDTGAPGPAGCVGYRPDLGGTREGAERLVEFLGAPYAVPPYDVAAYSCLADGHPYTVYVH